MCPAGEYLRTASYLTRPEIIDDRSSVLLQAPQRSLPTRHHARLERPAQDSSGRHCPGLGMLSVPLRKDSLGRLEVERVEGIIKSDVENRRDQPSLSGNGSL